jgi:hypothetical protein
VAARERRSRPCDAFKLNTLRDGRVLLERMTSLHVSEISFARTRLELSGPAIVACVVLQPSNNVASWFLHVGFAGASKTCPHEAGGLHFGPQERAHRTACVMITARVVAQCSLSYLALPLWGIHAVICDGLRRHCVFCFLRYEVARASSEVRQPAIKWRPLSLLPPWSQKSVAKQPANGHIHGYQCTVTNQVSINPS